MVKTEVFGAKILLHPFSTCTVGVIFFGELCFSKRPTDSSPFESKPRLARKNSIRDGSDGTNHQHVDFKPNGGVTFRDNRTSDVQVSYRYGPTSVPLMLNCSSPSNNNFSVPGQWKRWTVTPLGQLIIF